MFRYVLFLIFLLNFTPISAFDGDEDEGYIPLAASRLTSNQEHTDFLKHVLNSAINNVMISSYSVSPRRLFEEGVADTIINAAERGVKVYIYYKKPIPCYSKEDYADLSILEKHCERFEEICNHSKCVLRDKDLVAIGSYDWLYNSNKGSSNFSLVLSGGLAGGLNSDVWQGIRFYQSLKHENTGGVKKFTRNISAFSTGEYQFAPGQFQYTLSTPEAHEILLDEVLEKAKTRVLLFSPFIRLEKLQNTLTTALLHDLQRRDVRLQLITLPSPCDRTAREKGPIFSFLNSLRHTYPNFSYTTNPTLHAKTLMADDDLICEGSFNWLSAVSDIGHHANNFEMSIGIRGDIARGLIHSFEQTTLGKSVLPAQPNRREPSLDPKRFRVEQSLEQAKRPRTLTVTASPSFDHLFKIYSGVPYGRKGYSVVLKGDSLRDDRRRILYFETPKKAKEAAQALLLTSQTNEETSLESGSLWDELEEAAKEHLVTPSLTPTLGAQNSCSSSDSTFADSEDDEYDIETLAELDRLEQGASSQPQTSSQPTFSPTFFDESPSFGSSSSSDPRPGTVPSSFDRHVKIFSGAPFGKKGFCARFNDGGYLKDHKGQTCYFATREIAKQEAYTAWRR